LAIAYSYAQFVNLGAHFLRVNAEFLGYAQCGVTIYFLVFAALKNFFLYGIHAVSNPLLL
jgi:hypothetical protein